MTKAHLHSWIAGTARLIVLVSLIAMAQEKDNHVFRWNSVLASGKTVEVHGVNGSITASLSASSESQVEAVTTGPAADRIKVALFENPAGVLICAVPRGQQAAKESCDNTAFPDGVHVDFKLQLPAGVGLAVRNVNGTIKATSMRSSVDATTVNGDVSISTTETITSAQTKNGSLDVAMGKLWTGLLTIKTENGNIRLRLPRNASFHPAGGNVLIGGSGPVKLKGVVVSEREGNRAAPELELSTLHGHVTIGTQVQD